MAYRASTKRSSVKKKEEQTPIPPPTSGSMASVEEPVVKEMSIEDILGGPKGASEESISPKPVESTPLPAASSLQQHVSQEPQPMGYQKRPQQSYQSYNNGPRQQYGGRRPSYGREPYRRFGGGGRFSPPNRDFSDNGSNMTPDINVPTETVKGILDVMPEGHGFLRPKFTPSEKDVYISQSQIRRFNLRNGDEVQGQARAPKDNERYYGLLKVEKIDDVYAETIGVRPKFDDLIPIYPNVQLRLETGTMPLSTRIIDLLAPIGFGQRGLIVSPPKAGKTTILKEIAAGIAVNYPSVHLMAALIGERPEEVTDLSRSIKGEVLASNFDQSPSEQVRVAEVALDRAKRLVEQGKDVVILLDSITRLARAYNLVVNPSGRTLSGGFDPAALYPAKKFLGAARCVEKLAESGVGEEEKTEKKSETENKPSTGGSLTVIGTCLVDTGSRMDDLIYEEFKGTGNMELHLSRKLQERRVFPAIDISTSGTRHDELMLGEEAMKRVTTLRHMLALLSDDEQTVMMIERLGKTKLNAEFLESLNQG